MFRFALALVAAVTVACLSQKAAACDGCALQQQVYAAPLMQQYVQPLQVQAYAAPVFQQQVQSYAVPVQRQVIVQKQLAVQAYAAPVIARQRVRLLDRVRFAPQRSRQVIRSRNVAAAAVIGY
jgi:hypothetical protein